MDFWIVHSIFKIEFLSWICLNFFLIRQMQYYNRNKKSVWYFYNWEIVKIGIHYLIKNRIHFEINTHVSLIYLSCLKSEDCQKASDTRIRLYLRSRIPYKSYSSNVYVCIVVHISANILKHRDSTGITRNNLMCPCWIDKSWKRSQNVIRGWVSTDIEQKALIFC